MNEIISKWNEELTERDKKGEPIDTKQYVISKNIKIIDLKYLEEIKHANTITIIDRIVREYKDILKNNCEDIYPCLYYLNRVDTNRCKNYNRCFLCKLDYLISINRIKIVEI